MTTNQHENPKWPFPIHNGDRTMASHAILKVNEQRVNIEAVRYADPINLKFEEEALF